MGKRPTFSVLKLLFLKFLLKRQLGGIDAVAACLKVFFTELKV